LFLSALAIAVLAVSRAPGIRQDKALGRRVVSIFHLMLAGTLVAACIPTFGLLFSLAHLAVPALFVAGMRTLQDVGNGLGSAEGMRAVGAPDRDPTGDSELASSRAPDHTLNWIALSASLAGGGLGAVLTLEFAWMPASAAWALGLSMSGFVVGTLFKFLGAKGYDLVEVERL
jgi:hypothetical protein